MNAFLKKIASWIYGTGVWFHNFLYNSGILKSRTFDIPIICVGNITVGGTGKTPVAEMIIAHMSKRYNVALLSRGYGRRTKGYREVKADDSYRDVGDEPLQIKRKFRSVPVVVCEDRVKGVERIMQEFPEVNLIVMDDGFQHRRIEAKINIVVVDSTRPVEHDRLLPVGTLRDTLSSLSRAHYFVVSKCRKDMSPLDRSLHRKFLLRAAFQKVYFTRCHSLPAKPLFPEAVSESGCSLSYRDEVIAMSGIGNPSVFVDGLEERFKVVEKLNFDDHHIYRIRDLRMLLSLLAAHPSARIVMTEKDAVKLINSAKIPHALKERLFYIPIEMRYVEESDNAFLENLEKDVRGN